MEGHVRKRGSKWYYSFEAAEIGGKRKRIERVSVGGKKEAEAALRNALQEYNNSGLHFEPSELSMSDYLDYWYANYVLLNCKYNTQLDYKRICDKQIKPLLGAYRLKAITPAVVQEFINNKYLMGLSRHHLKNIISVLTGAIKYAVFPCGFIKDNPMQYVRLPRYEETKVEIDHSVIPISEFNQLVDRFPIGSNFYISLMIGYYTGCRIGEVMGLTWDDIDFENCTLTVNKILNKRKLDWYFGTPKTQSSNRTIKIGSTLIQALKQQKKWQTENRLKYGSHFVQQYEVEEIDGKNKLRRIHSLSLSIPSGTMTPLNMVNTKEDGEMISTESFKYAARVIHYELGITFNFHSLRHTHATVLIENGANIKDVQMRLGHANIETTLQTYTHQTEKTAAQSVDIFEGVANHK